MVAIALRSGCLALALALLLVGAAGAETPDWRKAPKTEPTGISGFFHRLGEGTRKLFSASSDKEDESSRKRSNRPGGFSLGRRQEPEVKKSWFSSWFEPEEPKPSRTLTGFMSSPRPSSR